MTRLASLAIPVLAALVSVTLPGDAAAAGPETTLTWDLTAGNAPVGTRTVTVKVLPGDQGTHRVIEAFTDLAGTVGPIRIRFQQRMTAHAEGSAPASFHSVIDENGTPSEIQGRWTPSGWFVSTNVAGRARNVDFPPSRIDLSTADLMDPESRVAPSQLAPAESGSSVTVRVLSAITGTVETGPLERLGPSDVTIDGTRIPVEGYSWAGPQGVSRFYYSAEGYLVQYQTTVQGIEVRGILQDPPPGGIDDFPVAIGRPDVETLPL
jgi:hypothetical protein